MTGSEVFCGRARERILPSFWRRYCSRGAVTARRISAMVAGMRGKVAIGKAESRNEELRVELGCGWEGEGDVAALGGEGPDGEHFERAGLDESGGLFALEDDGDLGGGDVGVIGDGAGGAGAGEEISEDLLAGGHGG